MARSRWPIVSTIVLAAAVRLRQDHTIIDVFGMVLRL